MLCQSSSGISYRDARGHLRHSCHWQTVLADERDVEGGRACLWCLSGQGPIVQSGGMRYAVAASSEWVDPDGVRRPSGEVHAWTSGSNQTA